MKLLTLLALAATACVGAGGTAEARQNRPPPPSQQSLIERYYNDPNYGYQGGQVCRRWCPEDRTPCDPVNFKAADGRCSPDR